MKRNPSDKKDRKSFELNNKTIALNTLCVPCNTEKILQAYKSKHSFKHKNKVILLVITDGKKVHYLPVKRLYALLRETTSNHNGNFYCVGCFHFYSTEKKLIKHERVCNDHDYCYVEMLNEDNKILKYNHGEKSLKAPFMICADLKGLLEKMHSCQNNPAKILYRKKTKHTPSGYLLFTNCSFDVAKSKLDC